MASPTLPTPIILCLFAGKTGWPWKVHSKRTIIDDYYGVSPAVVIMVIWWEGLHHAETSLDAWPGLRCVYKDVHEWPAMAVLSINLYYHYNTMEITAYCLVLGPTQYASLRMLAPNEMLEWELLAFSKGSLTMLSL